MKLSKLFAQGDSSPENKSYHYPLTITKEKEIEKKERENRGSTRKLVKDSVRVILAERDSERKKVNESVVVRVS